MPTKISTTAAGDSQTEGDGREDTRNGAGQGRRAWQLVSQPLWRIRNIYFWQPARMLYVPESAGTGEARCR